MYAVAQALNACPMKKSFLIFLCATTIATLAIAQGNADKKIKPYVTTGGELIFSLARLSIDQSEQGTPLRFSPVFNAQTWVHIDKNEHVGVFSGMSLRNVGFIYDIPGTDTRKKARSYNVGIPFAFKFGDMRGTFVYAGYEVELAFNYKEKTFVDGDKKDKFNRWFSDRMNLFQHGFFVGVQLPHDANIKFKYYVSKFYNSNFAETDANGTVVYPYQNIDANVFYFALTVMLRREKLEKFRHPDTYSTRR
jgi:hypothetical protein